MVEICVPCTEIPFFNPLAAKEVIEADPFEINYELFFSWSCHDLA